MPVAIVICLPLLIAVTLVVSGAAKRRSSETIASWDQLGVPAPLQHPALLRIHPWAEIVLGAVVAVFGGWVGLAAGIVAAALLGCYTALIARAVRADKAASCACFGAPAPVTPWTLGRNIWLTAAAIVAAVAAPWAPTIGGALRLAATNAWWVAALVITAATTLLIARGQGSGGPRPTTAPGRAADKRSAGSDPTAATAGKAAQVDDEHDYVRRPIPDVAITLADGSATNLREMAATKPILLLAVSPTCGACMPIINAQERFATLLPEVDVRLLLADAPDASPLTTTDEPQSLHDPDALISDALGGWPTPTAILLGADGELAGGPESGVGAIEEFVIDIYASLHDRPR